MRKAFVAGWPVSHSLSPVLHGYWLEKHGIDGSYEAVAIEQGAIGEFLAGMAGHFAGGNLTIPHKEDGFAACGELDEVARAIGAVNTVWLEDGKLTGTSTDAYGFATNLDQHAPAWRNGKTALVLGAGGAARSVVHALMSSGYRKIAIANRTLIRAENLAAHFSGQGQDVHLEPCELDKIAERIVEADLLVNTTSLGMKNNPPLDIDLGNAKLSLIVTDIVYAPLVTPLLKQAQAIGLQTVDGIGMLLHQAAPGFEKWFGVMPQVDDGLRRHVLDALAQRDTEQ